jgi:hypothetical protein
MPEVPCEQGEITGKGYACDQTIPRPNRPLCSVKMTTDLGGAHGGDEIEGNCRESLRKAPRGSASPAVIGSAEQFESGDNGGRQLVRRQQTFNLRSHRFNSDQIVDENIGVGENQRQLPLSSRVASLSRSPSFLVRDPLSDSRVSLRFGRSFSVRRYVSMASARTEENPFSPRREASDSKAVRCSGGTMLRLHFDCGSH